MLRSQKLYIVSILKKRIVEEVQTQRRAGFLPHTHQKRSRSRVYVDVPCFTVAPVF